jgi:hypothetical protein
MMEGPSASSEEKHESAGDIDPVAVDSLTALDPERSMREAEIKTYVRHFHFGRHSGQYDKVVIRSKFEVQKAPKMEAFCCGMGRGHSWSANASRNNWTRTFASGSRPTTRPSHLTIVLAPYARSADA